MTTTLLTLLALALPAHAGDGDLELRLALEALDDADAGDLLSPAKNPAAARGAKLRLTQVLAAGAEASDNPGQYEAIIDTIRAQAGGLASSADDVGDARRIIDHSRAGTAVWDSIDRQAGDLLNNLFDLERMALANGDTPLANVAGRFSKMLAVARWGSFGSVTARVVAWGRFLAPLGSVVAWVDHPALIAASAMWPGTAEAGVIDHDAHATALGFSDWQSLHTHLQNRYGGEAGFFVSDALSEMHDDTGYGAGGGSTSGWSWWSGSRSGSDSDTDEEGDATGGAPCLDGGGCIVIGDEGDLGNHSSSGEGSGIIWTEYPQGGQGPMEWPQDDGSEEDNDGLRQPYLAYYGPDGVLDVYDLGYTTQQVEAMQLTGGIIPVGVLAGPMYLGLLGYDTVTEELRIATTLMHVHNYAGWVNQ